MSRSILRCLLLLVFRFRKYAPFPGLAAEMCESEEIEALGFTFSPFLPPFGGVPPEFYQPGFPKVQRQAVEA